MMMMKIHPDVKVTKRNFHIVTRVALIESVLDHIVSFSSVKAGKNFFLMRSSTEVKVSLSLSLTTNPTVNLRSNPRLLYLFSKT